MPTYGYRCTGCGHEFSVFQSMKDAPIGTCPECQAEVKRLLYPVGIVFKGSGWYITDSRKPEKAEAAADGKAESAGAKAGDKATSETGGSGADKKESAPATT